MNILFTILAVLLLIVGLKMTSREDTHCCILAAGVLAILAVAWR